MGIKRRSCPKIIVILGPTASGKSDLAVSLAKDFDGEIISSDSRQVYKGMNLGTGKITTKETRGVPHHLLDVASPKRKFTVSQYKEKGEKAIQKILEREKLPIVCGGSAFYITALVDGIMIPDVSPDWKLRNKLEKKTTQELFEMLKKIDRRRAENIDKNNRRRLIRAVEITQKTKRPIPKIKKTKSYSPLFLGIEVNQEKLNKKIDKRLERRIQEGMLDEVKELRKSGISFKRLESFGLEYKWLAMYLQDKTNYEETVEGLSTDIKKFSKRQRREWKQDKRIKWIKNYTEAKKLVKYFLQK